jgi:hypothetical protein
MVYLLKAFARSPARPAPPQRRRTIIIGAGPTGISAAFHLGEHTLVLERRAALEETHDHPHDLPLGAARRSTLGVEGRGADRQRPGASVAERKALFIACSSTSEAAPDSSKLIHVARWQPPELSPEPAICEEAESRHYEVGSLRALIPLLRGELLFGACVMRVSPSLHMLELADGARFIYDKLLCTVPLPDVTAMVAHELASRISHEESLRFWLKEHDVEVADRANQFSEGDIDEIAAGKRMAAHINRALAERFQARRPRSRGSSFFEPRLVSGTVTATP